MSSDEKADRLKKLAETPAISQLLAAHAVATERLDQREYGRAMAKLIVDARRMATEYVARTAYAVEQQKLKAFEEWFRDGRLDTISDIRLSLFEARALIAEARDVSNVTRLETAIFNVESYIVGTFPWE